MQPKLHSKQTLPSGASFRGKRHCCVQSLSILPARPRPIAPSKTLTPGAQVGLSKPLPIGAQIYLLDANNKVAHLARVVWRRSDRAGLSFIESHAIGFRMPPSLRFLWKLFLESKFKEVYRLVSGGVPIELALSTTGLDEEHLRQMSRYGRVEKRFEILLRLAKDEEVGAKGRYRFNAKSKPQPA